MFLNGRCSRFGCHCARCRWQGGYNCIDRGLLGGDGGSACGACQGLPVSAEYFARRSLRCPGFETMPKPIDDTLPEPLRDT